jgi:vancomycin resistance protein YoaR
MAVRGRPRSRNRTPAALAAGAAGVVLALVLLLLAAGPDREAITAQARALAAEDRAVAVRLADERVRIRAAALGARVDVPATVDRTLDVGPLRRLGAPLLGEPALRPVVRIDERALRRTVAALARAVDRPPGFGAIKVDPDTLEVDTTAPRDGRTADRAALAALLRSRLRAPGSRAAVDVPIRTRRAPSAADVRRVARDARDFLDVGGLDLGRTRLTAAELAPVLSLERDGTDVELGVDARALERVVGKVAARIDVAAREPQIQAPAAGATLTAQGDVTWRPRKAGVSVTDGRAGRAVDRKALARSIRAAIAEDRHRATLRVRTIPAPRAGEVDALLGTFTTPFEPGQPRVTNIRRMVAAIDGTVVAAGATFSLNETAGQRTEDKGYVEAPFIAEGNRLEPSVGGGVSQVSTTTYNAAFFAGLPITAHTPHSIYIDRYPPGRETTLNFPDIDLRWVNDTGAPIVVRATAAGGSVTVSLYGKDTGRRVSAEAGPRRPVAGGDFEITVTRTIRFSDGRRTSARSTTRYGKPAAE